MCKKFGKMAKKTLTLITPFLFCGKTYAMLPSANDDFLSPSFNYSKIFEEEEEEENSIANMIGQKAQSIKSDSEQQIDSQSKNNEEPQENKESNVNETYQEEEKTESNNQNKRQRKIVAYNVELDINGLKELAAFLFTYDARRILYTVDLSKRKLKNPKQRRKIINDVENLIDIFSYSANTKLEKEILEIASKLKIGLTEHNKIDDYFCYELEILCSLSKSGLITIFSSIFKPIFVHSDLSHRNLNIFAQLQKYMPNFKSRFSDRKKRNEAYMLLQTILKNNMGRLKIKREINFNMSFANSTKLVTNVFSGDDKKDLFSKNLSLLLTEGNMQVFTD